MKEPFADLNGRQKAIEILRWMAVLPAAILGGLAAHLVAIIGNSPGCTRGMVNPDESVLDKFFVVLMSNALMGAVTVVAGAKTAPRHRRIVAVVLAVAFIFVCGMTFTVALQRQFSPWDFMAIIVGAVAAATGAAHVCLEKRDKAS